MPQLKLSFLGPPRVEWDGREVSLALRRGLALLAYLALSDGPHRRDELSAMLWPDADEREARSRLRHTLHRTSEIVGHPIFDTQGDTVRLARDVDIWVDTRELERCSPVDDPDDAELNQLSTVAAFYRGELLSGFTLADSPGWDDWQFLERERLRQVAGRLFQTLAQAELGAGQWEPGLVHARQWLALDPLHEPAHRVLMQLYFSSGQQAAALRQYQQCVRVLKSELDVEPEPETLELYQRIRSSRASADSPPAPTVAKPEQPRAAEPREAAEEPEQPVETLASAAGSLPQGLARYIGRQAEQNRVREILRGTSLLTLTGPGGIGKTRLAIELASEVAGVGHRDVRLVELASLTDPDRVSATVAAALGVADATGRPTVDTLVRALRNRNLLLVLDNCEHLVHACASLVDVLIQGCAGLSVLATSREPLGLAWEIVWPMLPLEIPAESKLDHLADIAEVDSVQLFVDRARMLRPSFTLTEANARDVAEICRRLDGIPLAIELAAVRLRVLSPRQILERLDDRFGLLTGGSRAVPARQQTLVATIEWSYHLLTELEQALFRRLAVFAGGWTLEAAEDVCVGGLLVAEDVLDLLASLVDKSLVTVDVRYAEPRYGFLDTIRAFALARLQEAEDEAPLRDRHQAWCFRMLREMEYALWGPEQTTLMARLDQEVDNIRAALDWCERSPDAAGQALRYCTFPLYRYWDVRGSAGEARSRLTALLAAADANAPLGGVAQTQACLAHFCMLSGLADEAHERALAAAALARTADDPWALIQTLLICTIIHGLLHDFDIVPPLCDEGMKVAAAIGHPFGTSPWHYWLGEVACMEGRLEEGQRLLEESAKIVIATGDTRERSTVKFVQGHAALLGGDAERAEQLIQETLRERYEARDAQVVPHCLDAEAWVASAQGDWNRAARLLGAAQAAAEAAGVILLPVWQADRERATSEARAHLGEPRLSELVADGRALSLDQAVELALRSQNEGAIGAA